MEHDGTLDLVAPDLRDEVATRLRRVHQRLTPKRAAIIDILAGAERPLTLPDILGADDDLAQSSVYRNLVVLEQAGVVHRIVTAESARFELAEELTGHHHHLICSSCGTVQDVPASSGLEASLADAVAQIEATTGFRTKAHRIDLVGLCERCS
jgi:Fur family transcriptional regulator, ferric uptake regulator